jgi:hypothetical protein
LVIDRLFLQPSQFVELTHQIDLALISGEHELGGVRILRILARDIARRGDGVIDQRQVVFIFDAK